MNSIIAQDTVRIPLPTSVKIIQDLGRLDEARVKIVLLEENIRNYQRLVDSYEQTEIRSKELIRNSQLISDFCKADLAAMNKKYKKEVRIKRLCQVLAIAAGGFAVYQTVK
jgi:histone deacetylase complex regulatory component SIN3